MKQMNNCIPKQKIQTIHKILNPPNPIHYYENLISAWGNYFHQ